MSAQQVIFIALAAVMIGFSLGVVIARNQVYAAMNLVGTFFCLAAIYALLSAHTLAVLQVLVYAGAIVVLFLFVIMLLAIEDKPRLPFLQVLSPMRVLGVLAGVGVAVVLVGLSLEPTQAKITGVYPEGGHTAVTFDHSPFRQSAFADMTATGATLGTGRSSSGVEFNVLEVGMQVPPRHVVEITAGAGSLKPGDVVELRPDVAVVQPRYGTVSELGAIMYSHYLLPFEATSLLLLVAIVGAVVVAKGKI